MEERKSQTYSQIGGITAPEASPVPKNPEEQHDVSVGVRFEAKSIDGDEEAGGCTPNKFVVDEGVATAAKDEDGTVRPNTKSTLKHFDDVEKSIRANKEVKRRHELLDPLPYFPGDIITKLGEQLQVVENLELPTAAAADQPFHERKKHKASHDAETKTTAGNGADDAIDPKIQAMLDILQGSDKDKQAMLGLFRAEREKSEETQRKLRAEREKSEKTQKLQDLAVEAMDEFTRMHRNLTNVHTALNEMARFSQAESSLSWSKAGVGTDTFEQAVFENKKRGRTEVTGELSPLVRKLLQHPDKLDKQIFDPTNMARTTEPPKNGNGKDKMQKLMTIVANAFDDWIDKSTILVGVKQKKKSTDKNFARNRDDYIEKIRTSSEWFRKRVKDNLTNFLAGTTSGDDQKNAAPDLFFPGALGYEVEGCHFVVIALVESIAECMVLENSTSERVKTFSGLKTRAVQEAVLVGSDRRHVRKIDIVLSKEGRAFLLMHDENMRLTIELMPISRKSQTVEHLQNEKRDQAVGHAAKSVAGSFNLLGFGASGKATTLSGSFVFLRVHHLKLTMKEPASCNDRCATLSYQESEALPLMSKESFEKVLNASKGQLTSKQREALKQHAKSFASRETIPLGICLLFEFMKKRKHDLLGFNMEDIAIDKTKKVLGSGTFGVILGDASDETTVWKVSTFLATDHFTKEIEALQALGGYEGKDPEDGAQGRRHLPLLKSTNSFPVKLGRKEHDLRCLELTPRGDPVMSLNLGVEEVINASKQISGGARFLHLKGFIHCDISPKNIVAYKTNNGYHYVLVDLGLSTKKGKKLQGFQGTVPFAAESIFNEYPNKEWSPKECHDYESLQYTMAALLQGGVPSWNMQPSPQSPKRDKGERKKQTKLFQEVIEGRRSAVKFLLKSKNVSWATVDELQILVKSPSSAGRQAEASGSGMEQNQQKQKKTKFKTRFSCFQRKKKEETG